MIFLAVFRMKVLLPLVYAACLSVVISISEGKEQGGDYDIRFNLVGGKLLPSVADVYVSISDVRAGSTGWFEWISKKDVGFQCHGGYIKSIQGVAFKDAECIVMGKIGITKVDHSSLADFLRAIPSV